jgi:hypothetical protein
MNTFRFKSLYPFYGAFLAAAVLAGCGDNKGPVEPGPPVTQDTTVATPPRAGSRYVLHSYELGQGGVMVDSSEAFDTITVAQTGLAVGGKTNVVAMRAQKDTSTAYFHYDTNGDFSFMTASDAHWSMQWRTFPIASKGKMGLPTKRDDNPSTGFIDVRNDSMYYEGAESVTVGTTTYACHKIRNIQTHDAEENDGRARYTRYYWYAPAVKMFVKYEEMYEGYYRSTGTVFFKRGPFYTYLISHSLQ